MVTKSGLLVCVVPERGSAVREARPSRAAQQHLGEELHRITRELAGGTHWQLGVGRPHAGPWGVFRSYGEALEALDFADRLDLPDPVVLADQLLVYRVFLRDQAAMIDLVRSVVGSLTEARGGAEPLLETLSAYFAVGGVAVEAARRLHLSVRAVTYRLERVKALTGRLTRSSGCRWRSPSLAPSCSAGPKPHSRRNDTDLVTLPAVGNAPP